MEHKHDLIDFRNDEDRARGEPTGWACRVCNEIITEPCRFCGKLPCTNEKVGCLHD